MFKTNEHIAERIIRVLIGAALLSQVFTGYQSMWFLVGLIPVLTGLFGICPIYSILGISTCPLKTTEK